MVTRRLSEAEHQRVSAAILAAEQGSDAEIVTIVASRSDAYHDVGLHYSVLGMLAVPALLALLPRASLDRASTILFGWNAEPGRTEAMIGLFALLAVVFLLIRLLLTNMRLRMMLTPGRTKSRRVHRRACETFRTGCELKTRGRTGMLIYLSLAEHRAEILADKAIAEQVEPEIWGEAMADLLEEVKAGRPGEGMARAVERVSVILARILPPTSEDVNELPDRLIEL